MDVDIIRHTEHPIRTIAVAARTCVDEHDPLFLDQFFRDTADAQQTTEFVDRVIKAGHWSCMEHVVFTFSISGISRICSHQLVRHRIASYNQQSQRTVARVGTPDGHTIPLSVLAQGVAAMRAWDDTLHAIQRGMDDLAALGIPAEDTRYLAPGATKTNLVMTMNMRELVTAAGLRMCECAQWEIRMLFALLRSRVDDVCPQLGKFMVSRCEWDKVCHEPKGCGKHPYIPPLSQI